MNLNIFIKGIISDYVLEKTNVTFIYEIKTDMVYITEFLFDIIYTIKLYNH